MRGRSSAGLNPDRGAPVVAAAIATALATALAGVLAAAVAATVAAQTNRPEPPHPPGTLVVGDFSGAPPGSLPREWKPPAFRGIADSTRYEAVADPALGQVVKATANASASALIRAIDLNPQTFHVLRWRWKIDNLIAKADVTKKDGDDYPARIYVSFRYDPLGASFVERAQYGALRLIYGEYPPHSGLNYIWDGTARVETTVPNPHTPRVAMIVVESGAAHLHEWRAYERNIVDDYRRAFGRDPPPISGIAIMTDADNTGESATAWYGNISLHPLQR